MNKKTKTKPTYRCFIFLFKFSFVDHVKKKKYIPTHFLGFVMEIGVVTTEAIDVSVSFYSSFASWSKYLSHFTTERNRNRAMKSFFCFLSLNFTKPMRKNYVQ